jgi:putative ABC transport system permease protein
MAWRSLRRTPGFLAVAVGILALGIGASTTMFSAIDAVLLQALPYHQPDRLVSMWESNQTEQVRASVSAGAFVDWQSSTTSYQELAAYRPWGFVLTGDGSAERVMGARVSTNLFSLLGESPLLGRAFRSEEGVAGATRSAMLSEALWHRRFGADSSLIGKSILLDGEPATVVGVAPSGFSLPSADLWVPLVFAPYELTQRGSRAFSVVGRLRPGVTVSAAQSELDAVSRTIERDHPDLSLGWGAKVVTLQQDLIGDTRTPLLLLFGATLALMLVACANLGNLLLTRATMRVKEMALRSALGGHRARLARQLLAENLIVVLLAAAIGLALATLGTAALGRFAPKGLIRSGDIHVSLSAFGFAGLMGLSIGLLLSLIPVSRLSRIDLGVALKAPASEPGRPGRKVTLRDLLLVGQVAVALLLLVGGGLLLRSLQNAQSVNPGFSSMGVTTATISLPNLKYGSPEQKLAFYQSASEKIAAIPGVSAVALASHLPLGAGPLMSDFTSVGSAETEAAVQPRAQLLVVSPGYFDATRIQLIRGRGFESTDRFGAPPVVIVDATLAEREWPGSDPIGRRLRVGAGLGADTTVKEVIGVVAGVRSLSLERAPEPIIYLPYAQTPWPTMSVVVRSRTSVDRLAPLLAGAVSSLDPDQPVYNVRSLEQAVDRALSYRCFQTGLLGGFAVSALMLAVMGVYGVMAFGVERRRREIGIRAALGATEGKTLGMILGGALLRVSTGVIVGALACLTLQRSMSSVLYGVGAFDPVTVIGAVAVVVLASSLAALVPAKRAMAIEPVEAMRAG